MGASSHPFAIFPGICRVHRAVVLKRRGSLAEAEREAARACEELRAEPRRQQRGRLRRGRRHPPPARRPRPGRGGLRPRRGAVRPAVRRPRPAAPRPGPRRRRAWRSITGCLGGARRTALARAGAAPDARARRHRRRRPRRAPTARWPSSTSIAAAYDTADRSGPTALVDAGPPQLAAARPRPPAPRCASALERVAGARRPLRGGDRPHAARPGAARRRRRGRRRRESFAAAAALFDQIGARLDARLVVRRRQAGAPGRAHRPGGRGAPPRRRRASPTTRSPPSSTSAPRPCRATSPTSSPRSACRPAPAATAFAFEHDLVEAAAKHDPAPYPVHLHG